jgi:hypothetical protein
VLNILSILIGGLALLLAMIAFVPLLGWANWFIIPLAMVGALVGFLSRSNAGRNLNLLVVVIGIVRLMLSGGLF